MRERIRYIIIILIGILGFNCQNSETDKKIFANQVSTIDIKSANEINNQGIWILSEYFDGIIKEKSISKFRLNDISEFALLINLEEDTIQIFGSIYSQKVEIENFYDTIMFERTQTGGLGTITHAKKYQNNSDTVTREEYYLNEIWSIIFTRDRKSIRLFKNDTVKQEYLYRRMNEIEKKYITIDKTNWFPLDKSIQELFNVELLAGKYLFESNDTIVFEENGNIKNLKNYTNYLIDNYFGTSHFFGNQDNVKLISENSSETWNWKFEGNYLILIKIKPKNDDYEQGFYLSNEIIKLKKIECQ